MSYLANDINNPSIQIDSVGIGLQLNDEDEAKNLNRLDLEKYKEFLVVGEKTYSINTADTINTKWNFIVNDNGVAINTSRNQANCNLTHDTSLYVDKNIHCSGIIKASGLQISNIILDNANPITCNLVKEFIVKTNELALSQPFKRSIYNTEFANNYNSYNNYNITNLYTPGYVTFGGEIDTYNNTNPLNIVTAPNSKFENMHISIRNDTNNDYNEPVRMCIGIIGGYKESPAIITTTRGVPLEFHVSKSAESINSSYGNSATPIYNVASNIPAMTIDANHNVGIGTNISSKYIYQKKSMQNNKTNIADVEDYARLDVKGLVAFENILIKDYVSGLYKNTDDIYIRNTGIGVLNATQINEGSFTGNNYSFNNNLSVSNLLNTQNINVGSNVEILKNTKTGSLNVVNDSVFNGEVIFNQNVNFQNTNLLSINNLNLNIENDIFINNRRLLPIDLSDPFTGYTKTINNNGSNFILMYISSNIASLDANSNINFPKKLGLGLKQHDTFEGVLNIMKGDNSTSNTFDITLKNTAANKNFVANIGRLSRLDYNDNSLIVNTNYINGKKNNIYFYPETDIKSLPNNYLSSNINNIFPTLSLLKNRVGINKLNPSSNFALDINGNISSVEYYIYADNNYKKTKSFIYNKEKNYFNVFDKLCDKYCINYAESGELAIDMKGLNVKKGINTDYYFQNNILIETLKRASNDSSFYTNNYISIGWKNEDNVVPLQIRNINTTDYNYSTIRIYRGTMGGGKYNNADYSGIDICEYDRDINSDRNKERWFIYKNHKYNDKDSRDKKRIGPLQIGYTDKTIEPTTYGMSFYYNTSNSMYHIDVNNPNLTEDDTSAMTIYGDLSVHGNINILDVNGCNFNFNMKGVSSQLKKVEKYLDNISCNIFNSAYSNLPNDKIITSFDIFRPKDNIIIDPIIDNEIPLIVKNVNNGSDIKPVSKFITYSKSDISYSTIELAIYNSNLYYYYDKDDMNNNIKSSIEISTCNDKNNRNTILDFNILNNGSYKNFLKFINTNSASGDIINSIAHIGIGDNKNSNILLHIDGNSKYGMQITNKSYPASINLVNTEGGKDIYYNISGGDYNNNNKFSIGVDVKNYSNYDPNIKNIFTIDTFKNNELRRGARFGFNEDFSNITNLNSTNSATFVINSEYNNVSAAIANRYTYDHIYSGSVNIDYKNISLLKSSNWDNTIKTYNNSIAQNINIFPDTDVDNNKINSDDILKEDFIVKKNNTLSSKLFYTTIHSNIIYTNNYSNVITSYDNYDNYNIITEYLSQFSRYDNNIYNNIIEIVPKKLIESVNDDIISEEHYVVENIAHNIQYTLANRDMEINYQYNNKYKKSLKINYNVQISNDTITNSTIDNSNYINVSNNIITTLLPFDNSKHITNILYRDIHKSKIFIDDNNESSYLEYSNLYLKTVTNNIIRYNSNISYNEKYYSIHSNYLNINSSNIYIEKLLNAAPVFRVSSNITDNKIIIKTSNYSINEIIDIDNKELILLNSNVFLDTFNILGYTCNNTLIIEDYINEYSNIDTKKFNIGIRNYNKTKYYPHISLINNIENNALSLRNTHDIYSYDGVFEIKYNDVLENDFTALRIDEKRNLYTGGDIVAVGALDIGKDLRIAGNIYDVHGNNLIELLNTNYYKNYEINASNIYLNFSGSNGVEINVSSSEKYDDYNLLYIKDYISSNVYNDVFVLSKSSNLNMDNFNLDLYSDLYVHCNVHIGGYGDKTSLLIQQRGNGNIISASNLSREVLTLANDGSLGLGVVDPRSVLVNMKQINGSNIISASNLSREVLTLANDGSLGLGVTDPRSVLMNMKQINGSNIISASNLSREVLTLANDGSLGLGVIDPRSVLVNMKQINGSNIISASNLSREVFTLANDGSLGLGVVDPRSVLVNMKQINGSNIISASNLSREVFTLANDGSLGLGVVDPRSVLMNIKQINGSNIISASNLSREVFTLANDGSLGLGVVDPRSVLVNMKQINGSNIISASNLSREVFTLANDGSLGLGVTDPRSVLMNIKQINGSNIISASNLSREVFTLANDGSLGLGVVDPRSVLMNMKQINGSNIISASNLSREVFTLANDGSLGLGVVDPRSVLVNMKQINGSNIISASNLSREVFTLANNGSLGLGVTDPRSVLMNMKQINGSNIISASNLSREVFTLANDGSLGLGVVDPRSVLVNMKQINGSNIISASNLSREVFTLANDGSLGLGVVDPRSVLVNIKQINGSNIISASNLSREVFTLANDGSLGLGVTDPRSVLVNMKQINGSNIISASNLSREVFTLANDGSLGLGVVDPRSVLVNMKQINGSNIISASNLSREVFTLANDGSLGLGVVDPRSVLINMKQINGSNIISASNLSREVFTLANDGSLGLGVVDPRSVLVNMKQINGSNIISASNLSREVFTLANDGSLGLGVTDPRSVLVNMKQINGSNIISASNLSREVLTLANDGSLGLGVVDPRSVLVNMKQINGSNIISASNLSREVFTLANDGSLGLGVTDPRSVLMNMRQINGSNIISASNLSREVFTLANDGSLGLGVTDPRSVLVNMKQINGSNIISASNLSREVFTLANDGSLGLGVVDPRSVLVNMKQINGSNIISASNLSREVLTLANDGSLGLGVTDPRSVLVNMKQINGSNIISASNLSREVLTLANDGSLGLGVVDPRSVLVNIKQINGSNIISASNLSREVFTLANDGSLGLGVTDPRSVLVNMKQINGSNIISASNLSREVFTLANDGSLGLGVVEPRSVLMNMKQINGSNIISASNLSREVFTLANDGSLGLGVVDPRSVLVNMKQINGSNIISASNLSREVFTLANDGSLGLGVTDPRSVLMNIKQINGSNIISASNLSREVFTLANDGSLGLGVTDPRSVLMNMKQINGSNIISASNLSREVFTLANDGSLGLGVVDPRSVLVNMKQINGSNIISASNLSREVFTLANDGSLGLGVVDPRSVLVNMKQINGSNIISASNLSREVFTLANDGSLGLGVVDPRSVLVNMKQINGSNIISASNLSREVFTLANDGSLGLGVTDPRSVLMNIKQINGSNIISASNLSREVFTLANDGSLGLGVVDPRSVLVNMKQINGSNIISASNLSREVLTLANDGSLGLGVVDPRSVLVNMKQINGSNIISASNLSREVFTLANDGSLGLGVTDPRSVLMNMKQINGSNIISASNLSREVFTLANDGSLGLGVTDPRSVLMNIKQINGSNIISASNLSREVFTLANDGSLGLGVVDPRSVLVNMKQINGSNIISASNLSREVLTLANDGSLGLGVVEPRSVLVNMKQINGSNIISASNLSREVLTLANDGSLGLGVVDPRSVLVNMKQINGSNIISASNLSREVFTLANDGSLGLGVVDPRSVLINMKQINGSNIISASNISREVFTLANDGSLGLGVTDPRSVLVNMKQINGSNIISASNLSREVFTLANDGSLGLGVVDPRSVLVNMKQINGSNIISASNLSREVFTLANDGSLGLGVVDPRSVLVNMKQINGSNIISASNLSREVLTLANDGSLGLGVTDPRSVLVNMKQINGSNIISASNLSREVFTLTNDGILGIGVNNPNKQSKLDVNGNINIVDNNSSGYIYTINNRDIIKDTCNYVEKTSNIISKRITDLSADYIADGNNNRFIINDIYNRDLYVNGQLTASNLIIHGSVTTLNTDIYATEQLNVTNSGQGSAVTIKQIANNNNIFSASNLDTSVFNIKYDGKVGINTDKPRVFLEINAKDGIKIPSGTTLERPATADLVAGTIRYNTTTTQFEGYGPGNNWGSLGGVKDVNNDTYISAETEPGINNDELQFYTSNIRKMTIKKDGKIGINTYEPRVFLEINTKDGIKIPSGTTLERPATADLVAGTIRYNTTTTQFEGYGPGNNWGSLGGVKDVNNDTYISAETEPGINNDELQFYTSNIRKMTIKKDGKIGINTYEPRVFLEINTKDGIKIPSGTTLERPATADLVAGTIRYNTTTTQFEGYGPGNNWGSLGGVKDVNNDTYISAETEPGINNDELQFYTSNIRKMTIKKDGKIGINTYEPRVFLEINTKDGIKIPSGTTLERPATADLVAGTIRYNTTTTQFEGYGPGNNWGSLGGVKDVNNDTYISAETEPGINNDELQFYTSNIRKMTIKKDGKIGINTYEPRVFLEINAKDGIKIPSGTTLERPATADLVAGTIRYNTTTTQFEGYGPGNNWGSLGGVKDVNNDTYISAETEPGINNDELQFYTSNIRKMIITKDGNVGIGSNILNPDYLLDVKGEVRITSNLFVNSNISIGTYNTDALLNIYGNSANIKIQDPANNVQGNTAIELINGPINKIQSNILTGWKMSNSNNFYIISSGSNNLIKDRLLINGTDGNIGVGTKPNHTLDVYGTLNASNYRINGKPFVLEFTQGMIVQTIHKTYRETKTKSDNTTGWIAIDNDINTGFIVSIKPSHASSKVLVNMSCHIGMDYAENSRWWGIQLYRKIGSTGNWTLVENANGSNSQGLEGSPCWISHNMGADSSLYSHSIINVSGSYEDLPNSTEIVYYTAYWKSKLNNTFGRLYLNRPATINSSYTSNYPLTSSSWTASEIWNNGISYTPTDATITIAHNNVGIGITPVQNTLFRLDVDGLIRSTNITHTSDYRTKKNIENIDNALDNINRLNPVSYLTLNQNNDDKKSYGFIAQELKEIFPYIVNEPVNNADLYSINYISIIPLLTKSIQELTMKIGIMQDEINALKSI